MTSTSPSHRGGLRFAAICLVLLGCDKSGGDARAPEEEVTMSEPSHAGPERSAGGQDGHHGVAHEGAKGHHDGGHGMAHDFSDVAHFKGRFEGPERDAWQKPDEVMRLMALHGGESVAEIGAGTGYFLPHLVRAVGASGKVWMLDAEPKMVEHLGQRIRDERVANAEAGAVAPADPGLAPRSLDRVLLVNTWHHLGDREQYAAKLAAALKPGGFVLVVDFTMDSPHGPPKAHRLEPEVVEAELRAGQLEVQRIEEALPNQYAIRASRR
jgi:ubiquinone/menaquinone biosynthesis C-methylase UbiE